MGSSVVGVVGEPSAKDDFQAWFVARGESYNENHNAMFARFSARYRAARSMSVTFSGYTRPDTAHGYECLLQVGMAYAALEALQKAMKEHAKSRSSSWTRVVVVSDQLAEDFRSDDAERLRAALQEHLDANPTREALAELAHRGADVTPLARGIRHMAFHGIFTPGTIGYKDRTKLGSLLQGLCTETLDETDRHFTRWVADLEAIRP